MERAEAELLMDGGNNAVVRLPGRQFPGVLIQGDSLNERGLHKWADSSRIFRGEWNRFQGC
ncbi:DUF6959 family protein [Streptomyces sp. NPDC003233]